MNVWAFGIVNNPEYRQDQWREWIEQALLVFRGIAIVCGNRGDAEMIKQAFPTNRVVAMDQPWPFPDWSYEELPRALNAAMTLAQYQGAQWGFRLDPDTFVHERDREKLMHAIRVGESWGKWALKVEKLQFFTPTRALEKGKMPVCINLRRQVAYGFDMDRYTDLCQPIEWFGERLVWNGKNMDTPIGKTLRKQMVGDAVGVRTFNYDYTFRTQERAKELLYWVERAHARFWGQGYAGLKIEEITRDTAMADFLKLALGRADRMNLQFELSDHPEAIRPVLGALTYAQWGNSLWGNIVQI